MLLRTPRHLLTLAALLCTALPSFAVNLSKNFDVATCEKPEYPRRAREAGEDGINMLGFLVRPDGTVANSMVLNSTGSRDLDRAALALLPKCTFKRAATTEYAGDLWIRIAYIWFTEGGEDMS